MAPTQKPEQTLTLSECPGILHRIARGMLMRHDAYYCTVDGKRTKVIPDPEPAGAGDSWDDWPAEPWESELIEEPAGDPGRDR